MPGIRTHGRRSMISGRGVWVSGPPVGERAGEDDPPRGIDLDEPVRLEARATCGQRRQQPAADSERGRGGELHGGQATGQETTRIDRSGSEYRPVRPRAAAYRFLPRTSNRCAVHSEPPRSIVAELPCQPQVQVIVWAWCLYSSITCLNGSLAMTGLTGGRLFKGDLLRVNGRRPWVNGGRTVYPFRPIPARITACRAREGQAVQSGPMW